MLIFVTACTTALVVSFVCSLLEATLLSLDEVHLETRSREGHRYAGLWQSMRRRIDRPIAAVLILNTVAHTGGATVAGSSFDELYGDEYIWVFSILFTAAVLIGTEIIPKVIGVGYADRLAPLFAVPLATMTRALSPIITVTEWIARPFTHKSAPRRISMADLRTVAGMARHQHLIGLEEENIILNATKLRQITVAQVMVPGDRMALFDLRQSNIANFEIAALSLHTRYPVTRDGTLDGIAGYVNLKEVVAMMPSRREVQLAAYLRPLSRVSAGANLNEALRQLLGHREHMAVVENQNQQVVGLITLEDVLEEILGNLPDEFDQLTDEILTVAEHRWKVGGGARVDRVMVEAGAPSPPGTGEATMAVWLHTRLGREPHVGDVVQEGGLTFTVIQTRRHKANRILVEKGVG